MALVPLRRVLLLKAVPFLEITNFKDCIEKTKFNNIVEVSQTDLFATMNLHHT